MFGNKEQPCGVDSLFPANDLKHMFRSLEPSPYRHMTYVIDLFTTFVGRIIFL